MERTRFASVALTDRMASASDPYVVTISAGVPAACCCAPAGALQSSRPATPKRTRNARSIRPVFIAPSSLEAPGAPPSGRKKPAQSIRGEGSDELLEDLPVGVVPQ